MNSALEIRPSSLTGHEWFGSQGFPVTRYDAPYPWGAEWQMGRSDDTNVRRLTVQSIGSPEYSGPLIVQLIVITKNITMGALDLVPKPGSQPQQRSSASSAWRQRKKA